MKGSRYLAVVAVLAASSIARAADLPVTYTVEEKPLKAAVAGTPLTFELYTDNACSGPVAHSEVVNIEDAELIVKLKPFNPKNAMKKPNTVEVRRTLTGLPVVSKSYLKVTGSGVIPVGGTCQVQGSTAAAGPVVKDANGVVVGTYLGAAGSFGDLFIVKVSPTIAAKIALGSDQALRGSDCVFFSGADCTGSAFVRTQDNFFGGGITPTGVVGSTVYAGSGVTANHTISSCGCDSVGGCFNSCGSSINGVPATAVDLSGVVAPFHIDMQ